MKKLIYILIIIFALTNKSFAAGSSDDTSNKKSNYSKAYNLIKSAKKYEKKVKLKKL